MHEISAGGVVYRWEGEEVQLLLIHDRYGRIALPKGKMEAGETLQQTALREINEETGISGEVIAPLARIHYTYKNAEFGKVNKEVHYFLVEATGGELKAQQEEINSVAWFPLEAAWQLQQSSGYDNNDEVVRKAMQLLMEK